jgi:hypothetical protein
MSAASAPAARISHRGSRRRAGRVGRAKTRYDYYLTGNPADAASSQPPRSPSTLLMGG